MIKRLPIALAIAALLFVDTSAGQHEALRRSGTQIGFVVGHYTFHGPVDLWKPRSDNNFVRFDDPAVGAVVTVPLPARRLYLRGHIGFTNFDTDDGTNILLSGFNDFIVNTTTWFEADLAVGLLPRTSLLMPYVFTGTGLLLADPFGRHTDDRRPRRKDQLKRTQVYFPLGVGLDLAISRRTSLFTEGVWRVSSNSLVGKSDESDPFNTSFALVGVRFGFGRDRIVPASIPELPEFPRLKYPLPKLDAYTLCCACALVDLQTISFENYSADLDSLATVNLEENIDALKQAENSDCMLLIRGYHGEDEVPELGNLRAERVQDFYRDGGIGVERTRLERPEMSEIACGTKGKKTTTAGCRDNQFVQTLPLCTSMRRCN